MGEDKLSRAQRVRLEAFNQAVSYHAALHGPVGNRDKEMADKVLLSLLMRAEEIEAWLWRADADRAAASAESVA